MFYVSYQEKQERLTVLRVTYSHRVFRPAVIYSSRHAAPVGTEHPLTLSASCPWYSAYGTTTVLKHKHYLGKLYQLEALKMQEKKNRNLRSINLPSHSHTTFKIPTKYRKWKPQYPTTVHFYFLFGFYFGYGPRYCTLQNFINAVWAYRS